MIGQSSRSGWYGITMLAVCLTLFVFWLVKLATYACIAGGLVLIGWIGYRIATVQFAQLAEICEALLRGLCNG